MPEASAARYRAQMGGMNGDDRLQSALLVVDEVDFLVCVEIGQAPGRRHLSRISGSVRGKMGRSRGLEPPTPGTTNQCSNQLSYDRHGISKERFLWPRAPLKGQARGTQGRARP